MLSLLLLRRPLANSNPALTSRLVIPVTGQQIKSLLPCCRGTNNTHSNIDASTEKDQD